MTALLLLTGTAYSFDSDENQLANNGDSLLCPNAPERRAHAERRVVGGQSGLSPFFARSTYPLLTSTPPVDPQ
jgi:hypothetical protein